MTQKKTSISTFLILVLVYSLALIDSDSIPQKKANSTFSYISHNMATFKSVFFGY